MSITSNVQLEDVVASRDTSGSELPSLKNTLLKPRNLLLILIFSVVLNFVLLIATVIASGGEKKPSVTPSPSKTVASNPSVTLKPSIRPSRTPDEVIVSLIDCFNNCYVDEILSRSKTVATEITNFKVSSSFTNYKNRNCYGYRIESSAPNNEYNSYFTEKCENDYISKPPADSIQIGDNFYVLNSTGNWDIQSKPRIGQLKLISVIDEAIAQQERKVEESPKGSRFKQVTTSSKTINDLNQQVTKKVILTFNNQLEFMDYRIETENVSLEIGYFFALREDNNLQAPF